MTFPVPDDLVKKTAEELYINDLKKATIREIVAIAGSIEKKTGLEFIHMEMGVPGLPPSSVGIEAEITALKNGVASIYPPIDGVSELKTQSSRFIKAFVDLDISPEGCVPVVGSMEGVFISFIVANQCHPDKDTILFIDPGFPVQKQQVHVLGYKYESFDVYDYRGDKLKDKLESYLSKGNISCIIYSNPNNPGWFCLQEKELQIIGEAATRYDTLVFEDFAYFAMDFRKDLGTPFQAPFQVSVGKYTDNYVLFISGSKAFSYAGQRIAIVAVPDKLYHRIYPGLTQKYGGGTFGSVLIQRVLYAVSTGATHSAQYALAAMFKAAADGQYHFLEEVKEYGRRAGKLKEIFLKYGFKLVYDNDLGEEIADGFYFTVAYPGMTGGELLKRLIPYGISAISLSTTGSKQEGLRVCTSFIKDHQYELLEQRLQAFQNKPIKNIAILASGSGSNAENIIRYFQNDVRIHFPFIISNKQNAYVHERAKKLHIPSLFYTKESFENGEVLAFLLENKIEFIVLAGFLLKIPLNIIRAYPNKIINIHPALLPKFGGKGMYGSYVHEAVVANKETESGITIHYVNENYDEGQIIFQAKCKILPTDTPEDVAAKVHELEYRYFPEIIETVFLFGQK